MVLERLGGTAPPEELEWRRGRGAYVVQVALRGRVVGGEAFARTLDGRLGHRVIRSSRFAASRVPGGVLFEGSGVGHGVGLCQAGAARRAAAGASWPVILGHYFPRARIGSLHAESQRGGPKNGQDRYRPYHGQPWRDGSICTRGTASRAPRSAAPGWALAQGDCLASLEKLPPHSVDLFFADPPYMLSNGGTTCQSGRRVSVDKGDWDVSRGVAGDHAFQREWLQACRRVLKPSGTIWVSGTQHVIFSIGFAMQELGYHLLNTVTWYKPNASPNLACRMFTHSTEILLWASPMKSKPLAHRFNYREMKQENGGKQMRDLWAITEQPEPGGEQVVWPLPTPPPAREGPRPPPDAEAARAARPGAWPPAPSRATWCSIPSAARGPPASPRCGPAAASSASSATRSTSSWRPAGSAPSSPRSPERGALPVPLAALGRSRPAWYSQPRERPAAAPSR